MKPCRDDARIQHFGILPIDVLENVVALGDARLHVRLHEAGMLHLMVSPSAYSGLLDGVVRYYANAHRRNLSRCLQMLPWHVYDDGTPIKKHGRVVVQTRS